MNEVVNGKWTGRRWVAPRLCSTRCSYRARRGREDPAPHIGEEKTLRAQWFKPSTDEATGAAAILLHGCEVSALIASSPPRGGKAKDWLLERGVAVVFPNCFTLRRFEEVCTVVKMQGTHHPP